MRRSYTAHVWDRENPGAPKRWIFGMDRRHLLRLLAQLPLQALTDRSVVANGIFSRDAAKEAYRSATGLVPSGPISSRAHGELIEWLDVAALNGNGISVRHRNVTVRNCRIRHTQGHGLYAEGAGGLVLQDIDIAGPINAIPRQPKEPGNNVSLFGCAGGRIVRLRASRGASNVYAEDSPRLHISHVELHDARGPYPRGQNVQFNRSPYGLLEDFSAENGLDAWTEDNISVFQSNRTVVRRGLVRYNNSPTGDGVMLEGSLKCLVEDVDAVQQGNGAFAAVPGGGGRSGGCTFRRCRTRDSYDSVRDGRPPPTSGGLSFYVSSSEGLEKHAIQDCHFDRVARPDNLVWDTRFLEKGWTLSPRPFQPRAAVRLHFPW